MKFLPATTLTLLLFGGGCGQPARVITDDRDKIVSLQSIDVQDWSNAAGQLVEQLVGSGVLAKASSDPARVEITRIVNDSTVRFDTDLLTQKIKIALQQTGKVEFTSTDARAKNVTATKDGVSNQNPLRLPYYTLNGKILEIRATAGKTKQSSYIFQMNLVRTNDDVDAWSGEAEITKKGTKNAKDSRG